jgi:hypothetical protein
LPRGERFADLPQEDYTFCNVCGRKVPLNQIGGQCVSCGRRACTRCTKLYQGRVYCVDCVPPPPPPPPPPPIKTSRCFIATATYGTPMAEEIQVLRNFRDLSLDAHLLGQKLVALYYRLSPEIAKKIAGHQSRRRVMRVVLDPVIRFMRERGY